MKGSYTVRADDDVVDGIPVQREQAESKVRILVVGDSFMPVGCFTKAFETLERRHQIEYIEGDGPAFAASTASERRLREYLGSPGQVADRMHGVDVLVVHAAPVTQDVVDASGELRLVCCARGGPVNVDIDALSNRGIPLINTPGKNAEAVADLTVAFLVMLARGLPKAIRFAAAGGDVGDNWVGAKFMGSDLRDHTLGIVGYGQVGRRVAHRVAAFGMTVLAYDPFVAATDVEQVQTVQELLGRSDFVSLHARATPDNVHLIGGDAFAAMKPGSFLINTARESLVDEDALDAALASGHLAGVALDVFRQGSAGERPALLRHENVVLTPHIGGATSETLLQGALTIAREIERFAADEPLTHVVGTSGRA
jgi:D-3-phosphoglycerate dehydrogenase / 2-oxoglutarate reductase